MENLFINAFTAPSPSRREAVYTMHPFWLIFVHFLVKARGLRGATVARLTPDQKVACSNHVGVKTFFCVSFALQNIRLFFLMCDVANLCHM